MSHSPHKKITKAVLPAAGFGTRLLPATTALPKELLPLVDTPVLQLLVEEAVTAGIEDIVFVINTGKEAIWNHFSPNRVLEHALVAAGKTEQLTELRRIWTMARFSYVLQSEQRGDGHAILQARHIIGDEAFLVLFGDDVVVHTETVAEQLMRVHAETGGAVVALQQVARDATSSYGIVRPGRVEGRKVAITGFVEKPEPQDAPSDLAIVGKYVCPPEIFEILEKNPNTSGEIRLIDALSELRTLHPVTGYLFEGVRYDTGNPLGYAIAFLDAALRHPATAAGVRAHIESLAH